MPLSRASTRGRYSRIVGVTAAPEADLNFDSEDHPITTAGSGMLPMLCTPTICNVAVTKTLIDGGAGLNMLSVEAFSLLHVPIERLRPRKPFFGVGDGSASPLGQIRLPVTFGTCRCQNRRISGRGSRSVRLRLMVTGSKGRNVYPGSGPLDGGKTLLPA